MFKSVLFVCTGNICRSPMAEYLFRQFLERSGETSVTVDSCGVYPVYGRAADPAIRVMREYGIDMTPHRSQILSPTLLTEETLVLTMEEAHKQHPLLRGRPGVYTLPEYASGGRENRDVADPYGGFLDDYRACAAGIGALLPAVLERMK